MSPDLANRVIRQYSRLPRRGQLPEDAINDLQVGERAGRTPAELIAELRAVGPVASRNWAYQFRLARLLAIPHPVAGLFSLRHLMWVIHSRDTWMHRLDICRATGRDFVQTADQDGRIAALVMLDVEKVLRGRLAGKSILFELTGISGGSWQAGSGEPSAVVKMDALDFCVFVSGRFQYDEGLARASLSGDARFAREMLKDLLVLF